MSTNPSQPNDTLLWAPNPGHGFSDKNCCHEPAFTLVAVLGSTRGLVAYPSCLGVLGITQQVWPVPVAGSKGSPSTYREVRAGPDTVVVDTSWFELATSNTMDGGCKFWIRVLP